jgi:hypothetical protein
MEIAGAHALAAREALRDRVVVIRPEAHQPTVLDRRDESAAGFAEPAERADELARVPLHADLLPRSPPLHRHARRAENI